SAVVPSLSVVSFRVWFSSSTVLSYPFLFTLLSTRLVRFINGQVTGRQIFAKATQDPLTTLAIARLFWVAYTLGMISAKKVMANVAPNVTRPTINSAGLLVPVILHMTNVAMVTIPTLTKS